MRRTRFLPSRPMSKQDVLDTIRDYYRFAEQLDLEAEFDVDLTFETTVKDWRIACDLPPGDDLWIALNGWFEVFISPLDWIPILEPSATATLGGVCELLASRAKMPDIKPFSLCGTECLSAGAFLTIRTALAREGVPVEGVRPSTPIEPLARSNLYAFSKALGRIAPDALPAPEVVEYRLAYRIGSWFLFGGFILLLVSILAGLTLALVGIACEVIAVLLLRDSNADPFKRLSFFEVKTFRDLTEAVTRRS